MRLLSLGCAAALLAQPPPFQVQSRLVQVPVAVTAGKGTVLEGLSAADFVLLDNGRPRKVSVDTFETGLPPIALVVAVQNSGISLAALEKVRKIGAMVGPLVTGSRGCAALLTFSEHIDWRQECTANIEKLSEAFAYLRTGEFKRGRILDAALAAIERLQERPRSRRILLLISEERDRGSESDVDTVVAAAEAAGVTIYAATYSPFKTAFTTSSSPQTPTPRQGARPPLATSRDPVPPPAAQQVDLLGGLEELNRLGKARTTPQLVKRTGGLTLSFARQTGLEDAIEKLGAELHNHYLLSFVPEDTEPGYHKLEVKLARTGKYTIRARGGFWVDPAKP